jgi:Short C-terminal domain
VTFHSPPGFGDVLALLVVGGLLFALIPAVVASRKGYSGGLFYVFALVAWPIALGVALLIDDKNAGGGRSTSDRMGQLERLVRLRDSGALTPAEFEAEKTRLMSA